jgi:signal transduction histidine kinase
MTAISLAFLVICVFGAFAYGSATIMALRQATPVWGTAGEGERGRAGLEGVSLTMFVACTVWFALNGIAELQLIGGEQAGRGSVYLAVFAMAFVFPPLIMHVVYRESECDDRESLAAGWRWAIGAMYVLSPIVGLTLTALILGLLPRPTGLGRYIGSAFTVLFLASSAYSVALMLRRRRLPSEKRPEQRRLGNAMLTLFFLVTLIFLNAAVFSDQSALVALLDRLTRTTPLFFLAVAVYFENRLEFYDLMVKRGVLLLAGIGALGIFFTLLQPFLAALPGGAVWPWVTAIAVVPIVLLAPSAYARLSASLDRLWFGRTFTAVEAVKHVLGAMQPAPDEATLVGETERRLQDIFGTPIAVRLDEGPAEGVEVEARTPSGGRVRFAALQGPGLRPVLSEDLVMLRSLASVFGFMLETVRLQHKRQEQELVARELRLQTSRSELKALRAQINPHFLFNALNAIASLIHTDPDRADEAVEQLSEVFRYTLRRSDSDWAPLDQELAFARAYLDVEQARFGQRLSCAIDADTTTPTPQVPSMLLQTLIENAVKHGVSQTRGPGRIDVIVRTAADQVVVEVRDNGPGPDVRATPRRDGEGFGLRSVRERLAGHFGDRAALTLTRDEQAGMTIARITMPLARVAA